MRIAIGSDHRGYDAKQRIAPLLRQLGHEVIDMGPEGPSKVDYPDHAFPVAWAVGEGRADRASLSRARMGGATLTALRDQVVAADA